MKRWKIAVVLGIRPDFIRTSKVLKLLAARPDVELSLIHTGQHHDQNLNGVFFEELEIPAVTHQLDTRGKNHNEQHAKLISHLSDALESIHPDVCLFLGDANAVVGCIAPLKLGIPIAHIEGLMRSYNWNMPEERNRVMIDRVSDVIYAYQQSYVPQGIREGISPTKICVTGNIIVDILNEYEYKTIQLGPFVSAAEFKFPKRKYAIMTLHRDEHMKNPDLAASIIAQVGETTQEEKLPVLFIEMPRMKSLGIKYPSNFIISPPLGFFDFVRLEQHAAIEFTDSGTNQETASIMNVPCVVTRDSTERPECNDCGTTVMTTSRIVRAARHVLDNRHLRNADFTLGDGKASERIVKDLVENRLPKGFYRDTLELANVYEHWKNFETF